MKGVQSPEQVVLPSDPNLVGSDEVGYEESDSEECDLLCSVGITEEVRVEHEGCL